MCARFPLKVEYRTEFRCQHQSAYFSSAFRLSGTAFLLGLGGGNWGLGLKGHTRQHDTAEETTEIEIVRPIEVCGQV